MENQNKRLGSYQKLLIGGVVLCLILLSSGLFLAARMKENPNDPKPNTNAPATATPTITDACKTVDVTPVANEVPRTTPTPDATPENDPTIPTPIPTPTPLFYDDFADNSQGWPVGQSGAYTRVVTDHQLLLCATNNKVLTETLPKGEPFKNFILTTTLTLAKADANDSVGFFLRGDSNLDHNYRIDIFGNRTIKIQKEYLNGKSKPDAIEIATYQKVPSLGGVGQPNIVKIVANGGLLQVTINGVVIDNIIDSEYAEGQIALFVSNGVTSESVIATFGNIEIQPVEELTPGFFVTPTAENQ